MRFMSLLSDIQSDAVDTRQSVSNVLRKCKILAARLGNNEFNAWVEHELNGYKSEDLPEYRIINVKSYGHFDGFGGSGLRNAVIPPSTIPKKYRESVTREYLMDPISYYEELMSTKNDDVNFQAQWNADLIAYVGDKIYHGMNCMSAWKMIPRGSIRGLLDTVRNRILSFVIDIEMKAPNAGEAPFDGRPIADETVKQSFNTIIVHGNVTNLASSGDQFIINIVPNDFDSLKQYLSSLGIGDSDLNELQEAINEDAFLGRQTKFGNKVGIWMVKMMSKAADGTWKIAVSAAGTLLAKALSAYFESV